MHMGLRMPRIVVPVVGVLLAGWVGVARAETRRSVVVLGFDGPTKTAAAAEHAVVKLLKKKHTLVSTKRYLDARRRLGALAPTAKHFARIAGAVGIDVIVSGEVRRRAGRSTLKLTLREGKTGQTVDTVRLPLRGGIVDTEALADELYDLIAWIEPGATGEADRMVAAVRTDRAPTRARGGDAAVPASEEPADEEPLAAAAGDSEDGLDDADDRTTETLVDDSVGDRAAGRASPGRIELAAGLSFIGRDLTFSHQASLAPAERPVSYDGQPVGGVTLDAEIFPFSFSDKVRARYGGRMTRLGAWFSFDRALGLRSQVTMQGEVHELPTTQGRWGVGARYHQPIGAVAISAEVGFNRLTHAIDAGAMDIGLPNVAYSYLDFGAGVRVPVGSRLAARGTARLLHVLAAGDLMAADGYGSGTAMGLDMNAGIEVRATPRIRVTGGLRYLRMGLDFDGTGRLSTDLDADPDQDVGGATDTYVGGYVLGGYSF
jgi:hypothetical protein